MWSFLVLAFLALIVSVAALVRAVLDHLRQVNQLRELEYRVVQAERLLRLRSNLANEIAHEIKNPVSAILCSAETMDLLLGEKLGDEHRQSLRYIREYGSSLLRLVSDFLEVSVAESGHLRAAPECFDLVPLAQTVFGILESSAVKKKIGLRLLAEEQQLPCYADPFHVKQIVFNLIHNAIKFTPAGGEVQVVVASDFPRPRVKLIVRDNGIGIPADQQQQLFDLYAQCENGALKNSDGVGLGLALSKSLVDLSHGEITIESKEGLGSAFTVCLPTNDQATLPCSDQEQRPLIGQHYLVVESDAEVGRQAVELIEILGGAVDLVCEGSQALQALETVSYSAVMIDYHADNGYGCELARMIKEDFCPPGTTVIVAAARLKEEETALAAGADSCISKPYSRDSLLKLLLRSGSCRIAQ